MPNEFDWRKEWENYVERWRPHSQLRTSSQNTGLAVVSADQYIRELEAEREAMQSSRDSWKKLSEDLGAEANWIEDRRLKENAEKDRRIAELEDGLKDAVDSYVDTSSSRCENCNYSFIDCESSGRFLSPRGDGEKLRVCAACLADDYTHEVSQNVRVIAEAKHG